MRRFDPDPRLQIFNKIGSKTGAALLGVAETVAGGCRFRWMYRLRITGRADCSRRLSALREPSSAHPCTALAASSPDAGVAESGAFTDGARLSSLPPPDPRPPIQAYRNGHGVETSAVDIGPCTQIPNRFSAAVWRRVLDHQQAMSILRYANTRIGIATSVSKLQIRARSHFSFRSRTRLTML
jgi:hypothetical protein